MDPAVFLEGQPLFSGFKPEKLNELVNASHVETYRPHDVIIARGETREDLGTIDHEGAIGVLVHAVTHPDQGVLRDTAEVSAVGHRASTVASRSATRWSSTKGWKRPSPVPRSSPLYIIR